jgi:hypothetical protein
MKRKRTQHLGGKPRPKTYVVTFAWVVGDEEVVDLNIMDRTFVTCLDGALKLDSDCWTMLEESLRQDYIEDFGIGEDDGHKQPFLQIYDVKEIQHHYAHNLFVDRFGKEISDKRFTDYLSLMRFQKKRMMSKEIPYS